MITGVFVTNLVNNRIGVPEIYRYYFYLYTEIHIPDEKISVSVYNRKFDKIYEGGNPRFYSFVFRLFITHYPSTHPTPDIFFLGKPYNSTPWYFGVNIALSHVSRIHTSWSWL